MLIRPIVDSDVESVIALWTQCDLTRPWNDPVADIRRARQTASAEIFIGTEEPGALIAAVMCGHDGHRAWLYYLAVAPNRQRQGLGRAIVEHAENWLRQQGAPKIELMIRDTNRDMTQFYESVGYRTEPVITMSRWLTTPTALPDD